MSYYKIGVALGGGGAKGLAHLGVLQHLEEREIKISCLSGTSAGAIVATLYSFRVPIKTIKEAITQLRPAKITAIKIGELGLFENQSLRDVLKEHLPKNAQIQQSHIPLTIHATDLLTGRAVTLSQGDVIEAVMASCCVPGVYLPVSWGNWLLVDGGLTENVPLSGLEYLGAHLKIAVNLNGQSEYERPENIVEVLTNSLDIAIDAQTRSQLKNADVCLDLDLREFSRTSTKKSEILMGLGLEKAQGQIKSQTQLIFWYRIQKLWKITKDLSPVKWPQVLSFFQRLK